MFIYVQLTLKIIIDAEKMLIVVILKLQNSIF